MAEAQRFDHILSAAARRIVDTGPEQRAYRLIVDSGHATGGGTAQRRNGLLEVFTECLPDFHSSNEYIHDPQTTCLCCLCSTDGDPETVVGGACYKSYPVAGYVEITLCAVRAAYQGKRIGSVLVDCVKRCVSADCYTRLFVQADNGAVGFWNSLGFDTPTLHPAWREGHTVCNHVTMLDCYFQMDLSGSLVGTAHSAECTTRMGSLAVAAVSKLSVDALCMTTQSTELADVLAQPSLQKIAGSLAISADRTVYGPGGDRESVIRAVDALNDACKDASGMSAKLEDAGVVLRSYADAAGRFLRVVDVASLSAQAAVVDLFHIFRSEDHSNDGMAVYQWDDLVLAAERLHRFKSAFPNGVGGLFVGSGSADEVVRRIETLRMALQDQPGSSARAVEWLLRVMRPIQPG